MSLLDTASLVITPNGYKEGKLYSVVPSDGSGDLNVTRATTATRVNASGLVELVPYNLLQYSEQLDNSSVWAAFSGTTLTANTVTAPDGTLTADRIQGASGGFRGVRQSISLDTTTCTLSVYLKSATGANQNARIWIDTTSQVVALTTEWQRFTLTALPTTSTFDVTISTAIGASIDVYAWGAQLVEGSTAKDYQKTETRLNIPRLDYTNGTCPSILVEPQRTNLALYSQQFDNASWVTQNATVEADLIISPDGIQNADKLNVTAFSYSGIYQNGNFASNKYTTSVFAKKGTKDWLYFMNASGIDAVAFFNISNGTLGNVSAGTSTIEDYGNGWYRCTYSDANNITNVYSQLGFSDANGSVQPTSSGYSYIYGFQREAGSYSTSYIPTTSASVTRNADVISKTGISSLIGQTEGTVFFDADVTNTTGLQIGTTDGGGDYINSIQIAFGASSTNVNVFNGGTPQFSNASAVSTGRKKVAIAYKANDFALYINGTQIATDTSGSVPTLSGIFFNHQNLGTTNGNINTTALWKTRLTNTQLASLTTI